MSDVMRKTFYNKIAQPVSSKRYKLAYAPIEDSDQPAQVRRLISVFDERPVGIQRSNVSSDEKLRLWSDYAGAQTCFNLRSTQKPTCTLCRITVPFWWVSQHQKKSKTFCTMIVHYIDGSRTHTQAEKQNLKKTRHQSNRNLLLIIWWAIFVELLLKIVTYITWFSFKPT